MKPLAFYADQRAHRSISQLHTSPIRLLIRLRRCPIYPQVHQIGSGKEPLTQETLEVNFRDDVVSNMTVMLLRMITSAEIQQRKDFFAPFIMVGGDWQMVESGCRWLAVTCCQCCSRRWCHVHWPDIPTPKHTPHNPIPPHTPRQPLTHSLPPCLPAWPV